MYNRIKGYFSTNEEACQQVVYMCADKLYKAIDEFQMDLGLNIDEMEFQKVGNQFKLVIKFRAFEEIK